MGGRPAQSGWREFGAGRGIEFRQHKVWPRGRNGSRPACVGPLGVSSGGGLLSEDPGIADFVRVHIPSLWALEILLLLRSDPARQWTAAAVVKELRASLALVEDILVRFERQGLAARDAEGWRFAAPHPTLDALAAQLAEAYRLTPMAVIALIARRDPVQSLADAFKFKGEGT